MRTPTLAALALALAALAPRPADACSIVSTFSGPFEPTQAVAEIPRNASIWKTAGGASGFVEIGEAQFPLENDGGALRGEPELTPGPVVFRLVSPAFDNGGTLPSVALEVLDVEDNEAPVFVADAPRVDVEAFPGSDNSCLPGSPGNFFHIRPPRAEDDFAVAGYRARWIEGDEVLREVTRVGANPDAHRFFLSEQVRVADFELVAFDLAGNESAPLRYHLDLDADPEAEGSGGCSAAGAATPAFGALALLLLARRRRRRAR